MSTDGDSRGDMDGSEETNPNGTSASRQQSRPHQEPEPEIAAAAQEPPIQSSSQKPPDGKTPTASKLIRGMADQ